MKLLLCKNVSKLGIVGDIIEVSSGYARNYLLPQRLATEPTQTNIRALADARRIAEHERAQMRIELEGLARRLEGAEVTIPARANEEGALYGSVGRRDVAAALAKEGYYLEPDQIILNPPIRHLDTVSVEVRLADDLKTMVKVWVVREKVAGEDGEEETDQVSVGREAGPDDHGDE